MDFAVLCVLLVQLGTGVATALTCRWGSNWFAAVATPYLWSLALLQPKLELVGPLPVLVKAHIFNSFVFLAIFPFSRLVHVITLPVQYLWRPWQVLVWNRSPWAKPAPKPLVARGVVAREIPLQEHEAVPVLAPRASEAGKPSGAT
jgi:nitrate reductase gamma subunit